MKAETEMKITFRTGNIVYNELKIDFEKPLAAQENCLLEDLLQVEFSKGYSLDVGWYPEFDLSGNFKIQLIQNGDWENPVYCVKCEDPEELEQGLRDAEDWILDGLQTCEKGKYE